MHVCYQLKYENSTTGLKRDKVGKSKNPVFLKERKPAENLD